MCSRFVAPQIQFGLQDASAVVLLGPRQIGKTTLAYELSQPGGIYLDLESFEGRSKLTNVEHICAPSKTSWWRLTKCSGCPPCFDPCAA